MDKDEQLKTSITDRRRTIKLRGRIMRGGAWIPTPRIPLIPLTKVTSFFLLEIPRYLILADLNMPHTINFPLKYPVSGAIIGDGDRKSWDARGPIIWDNFSIFRTNCAILTSYIRANPRTCRGFSRGCCHVAWLKMVRVASFHNDGRE